MSILLPGARSFREQRGSRVAFHWRAADGTLAPLTGQTYLLSQNGAPTLLPLTVTPRYGGAVLGGKAMPRFGWDGGLNLPYIGLTQLTSGKDIEQLVYYATLPTYVDLTVVLKLTGLWTPGANVTPAGYVFGLGNNPANEGGVLWIGRGTNAANFWTVWRQAGATGGSGANLPEPSSYVWPMDVMATCTAAGVAQISLRSGDGFSVASSLGAAVAAPGNSRYAGGVLELGSNYTGVLGQPINLHSAKIAFGIHTFAEMDALAS